MNIRHIILGLLARQGMTGYDIRSLFNGLSWLIEAPSYGSLYPMLHTLLEEGLVTVSMEPGRGRSPRKLYQISDLGQEVLQTALQSPELPERSTRAFARQLILADYLSPGDLQAHLARRRGQLEGYLQRLESGVEEQDLGQQLIHDYGSTIARAELAWLDTRLSELQVDT